MDYKEIKGNIKDRFSGSKVRNPKRYRLDFIKENTFNRVWSIRMTRSRVWLASIAFFCAVAALIFVVFAFMPMRGLLPGKMEKATRAGYLEASLRLDSLERIVEINALYNRKVREILEGRATGDSIPAMPPATDADSAALAARESEKQFVRDYEANQNFNLSVLAPIAAEGMDFASPVGAMASYTRPGQYKSVLISTGRTTPATAVYKGFVIAVIPSSDGLSTIIVQHPNDFVSVYGGIREVLVEKGASVARGQRMGHAAPPEGTITFELWHKGNSLSPEDYIDTL